MARYKVLHSIAHNFGQAFVGASKERAHDHLLGRLLRRRAVARGRRHCGSTSSPVRRRRQALVSRSLARILERYVRGFPDLVAGGHTDMQVIRGRGWS